MQAHAGQIAEKLKGSETAKEAVREIQKSGFANNLAEFGKMVKIHAAENELTTLMLSSQPVDICDQRFLCRMAKKLGCQFCAEK